MQPDAGSAVYEAIKQGNRAEALRLIDAKNGINDISQRGLTPLYQAIWLREEEIVVALLKNGANPNLLSRRKDSALSLAASVGSFPLVKRFYEMGIDPDPSGQRSALWSALCSSPRDDEELWRVVEFLIPVTNLSNETGPNLTCLYCAAARAPVRIVAALLKSGAPIPSTNSLGPILFQTKSLDVMRLLVASGADVQATDQWKRNLLHWFSGRNVEITRFLLSQKVNVNARDFEERVPLFSALQSSDTTSAELLLRSGADITAADRHGETVIFYAAKPANLASTSFLLKRGVSPRVRNNREETPIHATLRYLNDVRSERTELTRMLLDAGVDANALDQQGVTALHVAASQLDYAAMEVLLKHGADPNIGDPAGRSPLHWVAAFSIQPHLPTVSGAPQPSGVNQAFIDEQITKKEMAIEVLLRFRGDIAAKDRGDRRPVDLLNTTYEQKLKPILE